MEKGGEGGGSECHCRVGRVDKGEAWGRMRRGRGEGRGRKGRVQGNYTESGKVWKERWWRCEGVGRVDWKGTPKEGLGGGRGGRKTSQQSTGDGGM